MRWAGRRWSAGSRGRLRTYYRAMNEPELSAFGGMGQDEKDRSPAAAAGLTLASKGVKILS
jgi:hypothetical protein